MFTRNCTNIDKIKELLNSKISNLNSRSNLKKDDIFKDNKGTKYIIDGYTSDNELQGKMIKDNVVYN